MQCVCAFHSNLSSTANMGEIGEYWKDVKAHRKNQKATGQPRRRCFDWMVVSGDCHYAKNRSSFKNYRRVRGTAQGVPVIGMGTVELEVQRAPQSLDTYTLVLENVLHIPTAMCNGFNSPRFGGSQTWTKGGVQGLDASNGEPLWYGTEFCGLNKLVLAGNPQGESVLEEKAKDGYRFMLSMYLSAEEEAIFS